MLAWWQVSHQRWETGLGGGCQQAWRGGRGIQTVRAAAVLEPIVLCLLPPAHALLHRETSHLEDREGGQTPSRQGAPWEVRRGRGQPIPT